MEGILHLIKSKNPPVFAPTTRIVYTRSPEKGEAFVFNSGGFTMCNLSTVKEITKFDGFIVIQTLNSYYVLRPTEEQNECP